MLLELFCLFGNLGGIVILPYMYHLTASFAGCHKAPGKQLVFHCLYQIVRLTGQQRFIHFHAALEDNGICRYLVATFEKYHIVEHQLFRGNRPFFSIP